MYMNFFFVYTLSVVGFRLNHNTHRVSFSLAMGQPKNITFPRIFEDIPLLKTYKRETTEKKAPLWLTKTKALIEMARPSLIVPTAFLNLLGGFLVHPHLWALLTHVPFLSIMLVTQMVTAASMVINDWYDIDADQMNHPKRPLPSGTVTAREAFVFFLVLMSSAFALSWFQLPQMLNYILTDMVMITFYTPVFKKIPLVKNAVCAWVVASSLWISGQVTGIPLSTGSQVLMKASMSLLFSFSLYTEIMLDMADREGDQQQGIRTLPVMFGNRGSLLAAFAFLSLGTVTTVVQLGSSWPLLSLFVVAMWVRSWNRAVLATQQKFDALVLRSISRETNVFLGLYFAGLLWTKFV
jgi:geranylgeranylglycerol-phosphate geranylgeranyltransferase